MYPGVTAQIALDAARHLSRAYPPGQTVVFVDGQSPFGQALEQNLRRQGFTISPTGLQIGYTLDVLQGEASPVCYLSLRLPDGIVTQSYAVSGGLAVPEGVFAKTGLASYSPAYEASDVETVPLADSVLLPAAGPAALAEGAVSPPASPDASLPAHSPPASPPSSPVIAAALADVAREKPPAAPPAPLPAPVISAAPASVPHESAWTIKPGLLRPQLSQWAASAGYQLVWKAEHDFDMESSAIFRDDFEGAIQRLFTRMHLQGNPLKVTVYQVNHVIEVVED